LGFVNPYLYVLFILALPLNMSRSLLLVLAFVLGLSIDTFVGTPGVHAFACVFVAFVREPLLKLLLPRDDNHELFTPSMRSLGEGVYLKYAVLMVFIHHIVLFLIEAFSFQHFGFLLLRIVASSLFTLVLLLGIERLKLHNR
jgi:rod shape-determining protein MreD